MIQIENWEKWQGTGLRDVRRMREKRGSADRPYAMGYVCIAVALDGDFKAFARALLNRDAAESMFIRVLQYVATHDAMNGTLDVDREAFGPIVLTREWSFVSPEDGARVYDALIASGIASLASSSKEHPTRSEPRPEPSSERVPNSVQNPVPDLSRTPGLSSPLLSDPPSAHARVPAPAREGAANDGGGDSASPPPAAATAAATTADEPLSPEDEAVATKIIAKLRASDLPSDQATGEKALLALRSPERSGDEARRFIDRFTVRFLDEVQKVRRTFAMARNGRLGTSRKERRS